MKHGKGRLTPIQTKRFTFWRARGLTAHQARMFSEFALARPYMVRFYRDLQNTPNFRALTDDDLWALWRRDYDISVGLGEYDPPPERHYSGKGPHRKLNPDGSINREHTRNYERSRRATTRASGSQRGRAATDRDWIRQLEEAIRNTEDHVRRAQYQAQIESIRARLGRNA